MNKSAIGIMVQQQKQFFLTQQTKNSNWRILQLKKLRCTIIKHTQAILDALHNDLHKPAFEAYTGEVYQVIQEINYLVRHMHCLTRKRHTKTPLHLWPATSYVRPTPYGTVLIMAPWNFPFQLTMIPLVGALAAGNCTVVKPSEFAPHTAAIIQKIINECFQKDYVGVVQGDVDVAQALLDHPFDYIFFTGSTRVGKIVMHKAADQLIPLTLELGGKNPCIVDSSASLTLAAKRIAWAKYYNAGQNCVAPDYILVHEDVKHIFIQQIKKYIIQFYGSNPQESPDYGRIINHKHVKRLEALLQDGTIVFGGNLNEEAGYISPTIIENIVATDPIMQEEIFGPLLPILTYKSVDEAIAMVNKLPKPLALYIFANDSCIQHKLTQSIVTGAVAINDCMVQAASVYLPFGGVGASGFGRYHGRYSFETFTYQRAIFKKPSIEIPIRYAPYKKISTLLQRLLSWLA